MVHKWGGKQICLFTSRLSTLFYFTHPLSSEKGTDAIPSYMGAPLAECPQNIFRAVGRDPYARSEKKRSNVQEQQAPHLQKVVQGLNYFFIH